MKMIKENDVNFLQRLKDKKSANIQAELNKYNYI
jgi:hypothetical protein